MKFLSCRVKKKMMKKSCVLNFLHLDFAGSVLIELWHEISSNLTF